MQWISLNDMMCLCVEYLYGLKFEAFSICVWIIVRPQTDTWLPQVGVWIEHSGWEWTALHVSIFTNSILIHLDSPRVLVQALLENGGPVAHVNEDVSYNQTYEDDVRTYNAVEPLFAESDIVQADCLCKHVWIHLFHLLHIGIEPCGSVSCSNQWSWDKLDTYARTSLRLIDWGASF